MGKDIPSGTICFDSFIISSNVIPSLVIILFGIIRVSPYKNIDIFVDHLKKGNYMQLY